MKLSLRPATKDDALLIADISRLCFYETFAPDNRKEDMDKFMNEQFTRAKLLYEVSSPENTFYLAYVEGEIAGHVKLREGKEPASIKNQKALEIARLYAMPNMIGKGVGKILMQKSIEEAEKRNKNLLWLGVWEKNERAIRFYKSWGFEKFDETDFLLGDDLQLDWLMKKELKMAE